MPRHPIVSTSTRTLSAGVFSALGERVKNHPRPVCPLHVGDTWREPYAGARAEAQRTADHPHLHTYSPVSGEPVLRAAIRDHLATRFAETGIAPFDTPLCVISGATSGLSVVCQALVDPGDEVLIPAPFWPLIRGIVASRGATPVEVPVFDRLGADPTFDLEAALEAAVTPKTVAIYLNTPHNPTGRILTVDEIGVFARVAARHDLWLLCDEVYETLYYGDTPPYPAWAHPEVRERAVAIHSMSKAFGLAGARVGWVHGAPTAMTAITAVQTFQVYCASKPMQLAAACALREGQAWLAETRDLYREAARITTETFGIAPPQAGTFVFANIAKWLRPGEDATGFLIRCLEGADVLLTPGLASGAAYAAWVRICFTAAPPDELAAAMGRLRATLMAG